MRKNSVTFKIRDASNICTACYTVTKNNKFTKTDSKTKTQAILNNITKLKGATKRAENWEIRFQNGCRG